MFPALLTIACSAIGERMAAQNYLAQMEPVIQEQHALAIAQLRLAREVVEDDISDEAILKRIDQVMLSSAGAVKNQALVVDPPPALAEAHGMLVAAWTERVEATTSLLAAHRGKDLQAYDAAMEQNLASKIAEEEAFRRLNEGLAPHGLSVDPVP